MAEICCDDEGWRGLNYMWAHCRGGEEACLTIELLAVESGYAYVGVDPSWRDTEAQHIDKGSYIEYMEGDTRWRVYCDDVNASQNLAKIRICYEPVDLWCHDFTDEENCKRAGCHWWGDACHADPEGTFEKDVEEGDEFNWKGHAIKILNIVCGPVNYVDAAIDGVTKHLTFDEDATAKDWFLATIFPGPLLGGALFICVKSISAGCNGAKLAITGGGLSEEERDVIDGEIIDEGVVTPDGTVIPVTPEEVEAADLQAYKDMLRSSEHDEALQKKADGDWTLEQLKTFEKEWKKERTKEIIIVDHYASNFDIIVPSIVMAGDVEISGTAPKANQKMEIMIQKKYFGFDAFAEDTSLGEITSGDDNKYTTTVVLEDFGAVTVYARVQKGWIEGLLDPITTPKHTIYVITWLIVLAVIVAAALIYDKQQKGKFIGIFKKKR